MSTPAKPADVEMVENDLTADDGTQKVPTTVHNDEAINALFAEHGSSTWGTEEEKALVKKIDWSLLWILCIVYPLQIYDKNMLGQAAIFGLRDDMNLSQTEYSMASGFLYIGFLFGSYPASLLAQLFPVSRVAGGIIFVWAACLILTVVCHNFAGVVTQRIFLGFLEGGVSPIFVLVTASWYTKSEQALRMGIWWCSGGYAGFFAPLINYAIGLIKGGSLRSWQYMYIVAGVLTLLLAVLTFLFLPADPITAKRFSSREKYIAVARLRGNNSGVRNTHWKKEQIIEALIDIRFWVMVLIGLFSMLGNGAFSTMTPIIINTNFGFGPLHSLLLSSPAGLIMGTTQLISSIVTSKTTNKRCIVMFVSQIPVLVGAVLLWALPRNNVGPLLFALYCIPCFGATYNTALALNIANVAGYTKRTVFASGIFIGYCMGNLIGPLSFTKQDAPNYTAAFAFLTCSTITCMALIMFYRFLCIRENRKRDATGVAEGFDHAFEDDVTDKLNPQFRYIY